MIYRNSSVSQVRSFDIQWLFIDVIGIKKTDLIKQQTKIVPIFCDQNMLWNPIHTNLRSVLSPYLTGCSRLASTSAPGLRQFSHRQPWWNQTYTSVHLNTFHFNLGITLCAREADVSYLLSTKACAGADSAQVLLLPLVSYLVSFAIIVAHWVICVGIHAWLKFTCNSCTSFWDPHRTFQVALRGSHLNSPLPFPKQVQLIKWPFSARRSHFSPMR